MRSFSYTLRPSTVAVSEAFGVDALKQLAAQPTPRLDRSPWQGFGTATDATPARARGIGATIPAFLPRGANRVAFPPGDEFLAELEARMASPPRASGVPPPLTAEALQ